MNLRLVVWSAAVVGACACSTADEPSCVQFAKIEKEKVVPSLESTIKFSTKETGIFVEIDEAVTIGCPAEGKEHVFWHWDYDPNLGKVGVATSTFCGGERKCFVNPCNLPSASQPHHKLAVVVATGPRKPEAASIYDFPAGTHFDSASWSFQLNGICP